jgi:hypothetical protein
MTVSLLLIAVGAIRFVVGPANVSGTMVAMSTNADTRIGDLAGDARRRVGE